MTEAFSVILHEAISTPSEHKLRICEEMWAEHSVLMLILVTCKLSPFHCNFI